jgi:hypothetical protein
MTRSKGKPAALAKRKHKLDVAWEAIELIRKRIEDKTITTSISDLIRLLEFVGGLTPPEPVPETIVTWVNPYRAKEPPEEGELEELLVS